MKYKLFIPCCEQSNLLSRALSSVKRIHQFVEIIDNTKEGIKGVDLFIHKSPVPLTFVQTQNWIQQIAFEQELDVILWMHDDAYFSDETACEDFVNNVEKLFQEDSDWGVLFTYYDSCCAYNMRAVRQVGSWDQGFHQYVSEVDWYHRVRETGFFTRDDGQVHGRIIHEASSTVNRDPWYDKIVKTHQIFSLKYYLEKWGGSPGEEKDKIPFRGEIRLQWLEKIRSSEIYKRLSSCFYTNEGNLLEITNETTSLCQTEIIEQYIRLATKSNKKINVLETGTNKGMFALLLDNLGGGNLWTHDCDPRTEEISQILQNLSKTKVEHKLGLSQEALSRFDTENYRGFFDLFWVDGGHDFEPCLSDLTNAVRLEVPYILIDDCNMDTVQRAIKEVLINEVSYVEAPNGLHFLDDRKLRVFRRRKT